MIDSVESKFNCVFCVRLKDARRQVAVKEKSHQDSQKAYDKEQSALKNIQKELATIEVMLVC